MPDASQLGWDWPDFTSFLPGFYQAVLGKGMPLFCFDIEEVLQHLADTHFGQQVALFTGSASQGSQQLSHIPGPPRPAYGKGTRHTTPGLFEAHLR